MVLEKLNSVLCVNDNDITLFILKRALTKSNFAETINEKKNGFEAFKYCEQLIAENAHLTGDYPKVIFLDLHMPVMDGWEFLERFSSDIWPYFTDTKIVITSQSVDAQDSLRANEHAFVADFMKQPITIEYLTRLHENLAVNI